MNEEILELLTKQLKELEAKEEKTEQDLKDIEKYKKLIIEDLPVIDLPQEAQPTKIKKTVEERNKQAKEAKEILDHEEEPEEEPEEEKSIFNKWVVFSVVGVGVLLGGSVFLNKIINDQEANEHTDAQPNKTAEKPMFSGNSHNFTAQGGN